MIPGWFEKPAGVDPADWDKFWSHVLADAETGCWFWMLKSGPRKGQRSIRYGAFYTLERPFEHSHRVAARWLLGELAPGAVVLHSCDRPPCVSPLHLVIGTTRENVWDAIRKGRQPLALRAVPPPTQKLDASHVHAIKRLVASGVRQSTIARAFDVTDGTISMIVTGRSWRSLGPTPEVA